MHNSCFHVKLIWTQQAQNNHEKELLFPFWQVGNWFFASIEFELPDDMELSFDLYQPIFADPKLLGDLKTEDWCLSKETKRPESWLEKNDTTWDKSPYSHGNPSG